MPIGVYRWEDKGVLIHHCPVCHSPLAAEKARTTCLGKHVEWCSQYHPQLFKMNSSRECMACCKAEREQAKRYREIAELVRRVRDNSSLTETKTKTVTTTTSTSPRKGWVEPDKSLTKDERKVKKKAAKRAEEKPLVASHAEVEAVVAVLNSAYFGEGGKEINLLEDDIIQQNVSYHRQNGNTKEIRREMAFEPRDAAMERWEEPRVGDLDGLLGRLGVDSRVGDEGVERLREAMRKDALTVWAERREIRMRKAGFWRWASRKAYLRLVEHGSCWDEKEDIDPRDEGGEEEKENEREEEGRERGDLEVVASPPPVTPKKENVTPSGPETERKKGMTLVLCGNGGLRKLSINVGVKVSPGILSANYADKHE